MSFPCSSVGKESACHAGDPASIHGSGRSSGEGNGNSLQYSCLKNPMDRGTWQATVHGGHKEFINDDMLQIIMTRKVMSQASLKGPLGVRRQLLT